MDERVGKAIRTYLVHHDAVQVALFGSYVRGEERADSDIDVLSRMQVVYG